jgi:outer membrane receptor protein involved in Fe transport
VVAAVGVFYKRDEYRYTASPEAGVFIGPPGQPCTPDVECRSDIQGFSASQDIKGEDSNFDFYAELLVPLLRDAPGARSLETVLGYRSSDYDSAGRFDSWKAELLYQPVDSLRVRGSYQEAVRAPGVSELYLPQLPSTFIFSENGFADPCTVGSPERAGPDGARVEALCLAQGMPASVLPTFEDSDDIALGVVGGNPDLAQEEASTTTLGVVWTSPFPQPALARLQVTLDWYRIDVTDKIDWVLFPEFVPFCYDAHYNPDFSTSNQWCSLFSRDGATGEITNVREVYNNGYDWKTSGVDMQLDWSIDAGPGQFGISWLVSWLDSFSVAFTGIAEPDTDSTAPDSERAGTIGFNVGGSLPEWKSTLRVSYAWPDLEVGAGWRYIDSMQDRDPNLETGYGVPSVSYFDVDAHYGFSGSFLGGLEIGIGIENLTDEDPPIYPSYIQANTDPSQYDPYGRRYYANLRYSF